MTLTSAACLAQAPWDDIIKRLAGVYGEMLRNLGA